MGLQEIFKHIIDLPKDTEKFHKDHAKSITEYTVGSLGSCAIGLSMFPESPYLFPLTLTALANAFYTLHHVEKPKKNIPKETLCNRKIAAGFMVGLVPVLLASVVELKEELTTLKAQDTKEKENYILVEKTPLMRSFQKQNPAGVHTLQQHAQETMDSLIIESQNKGNICPISSYDQTPQNCASFHNKQL